MIALTGIILSSCATLNIESTGQFLTGLVQLKADLNRLLDETEELEYTAGSRLIADRKLIDGQINVNQPITGQITYSMPQEIRQSLNLTMDVLIEYGTVLNEAANYKSSGQVKDALTGLSSEAIGAEAYISGIAGKPSTAAEYANELSIVSSALGALADWAGSHSVKSDAREIAEKTNPHIKRLMRGVDNLVGDIDRSMYLASSDVQQRGLAGSYTTAYRQAILLPFATGHQRIVKRLHEEVKNLPDQNFDEEYEKRQKKIIALQEVQFSIENVYLTNLAAFEAIKKTTVLIEGYHDKAAEGKPFNLDSFVDTISYVVNDAKNGQEEAKKRLEESLKAAGELGLEFGQIIRKGKENAPN